jgi:ADP-ribosylglycohydrolase
VRAAVASATERCQSAEGGAEVAGALERAVTLADAARKPTPERIERLGGGWVAEEALAISVYCVLSAPSASDALAIAVNHSGDSDSTGSIAGNIVGGALGVGWLDAELLRDLEGSAVIEQVANDLYEAFQSGADVDRNWERYPPF